MIKKVLVTGITGKSGIYMLRELVSHADELQNYRFKVLVRKSSKIEEITEAAKKIHIDVCVGDKNVPEDIERFCQGGSDILRF